MAAVSLLAVGAKLKRGASATVSLIQCALNGYTRTLAVSGYARVNPFEVEAGRADDPSATPPYSLAAWENYDHDRVPAGSNLVASLGYGEVTLTWTRPAGYTRATGTVSQKIYAKDSGQTEVNETATSTNPYSLPDQSQDAGDGTSDTIDLSTYGDNYVAVGVKAAFDDSDEVFEASDSLGYAAGAGATPLTGAGAGILVKAYGTNPGPLSVTQTTDPATCYVGNDVTIRIQCSMEGPSTGTLQEQKDGGSWTTLDSSVTAGTSQIDLTRASDGSEYKYRLRYNDVSPDEWATQTGTITPICNLV